MANAIEVSPYSKRCYFDMRSPVIERATTKVVFESFLSTLNSVTLVGTLPAALLHFLVICRFVDFHNVDAKAQGPHAGK